MAAFAPGEAAKSGRGLLHDVAGSYVLTSVPRSVFILQAGSDDPTHDTVVCSCVKNNDGDMGERSAWHRANGIWRPAEAFDWEGFNSSASERKRGVALSDLEAVFDGGNRRLARKNAVEELMQATGLNKSACYSALKLDGPFEANLSEDGGVLAFHSANSLGGSWNGKSSTRLSMESAGNLEPIRL